MNNSYDYQEPNFSVNALANPSLTKQQVGFRACTRKRTLEKHFAGCTGRHDSLPLHKGAKLKQHSAVIARFSKATILSQP